MSPNVRAIALIVVVFPWGMGTAHAQVRRTMALPAGGIVFVARSEAVGKEIGLDDAAAAKVREIIAEFSRATRAAQDSSVQELEKLEALDKAERDPLLKDLMSRTDAVVRLREENVVLQLKGALSPAQFERLQQIAWQLAGSFAFTNDPELGKALELDKDQIAAISALNVEYERKGRAITRPGVSVQEGVAKHRELAAERDGKAMELLTKAQTEKLTKLLGKPFDITRLDPRG